MRSSLGLDELTDVNGQTLLLGLTPAVAVVKPVVHEMELGIEIDLFILTLIVEKITNKCHSLVM